MIAKIDSRLRQAKCEMNKPFGGCSVILTGDPAQLLPVAASPLYNKNTKRVLQQLGLNAYQLFSIVFIFFTWTSKYFKSKLPLISAIPNFSTEIFSLSNDC